MESCASVIFSQRRQLRKVGTRSKLASRTPDDVFSLFLGCLGMLLDMM